MHSQNHNLNFRGLPPVNQFDMPATPPHHHDIRRTGHERPPHERIEELEARVDYLEKVLESLIKHVQFVPTEDLLGINHE